MFPKTVEVFRIWQYPGPETGSVDADVLLRSWEVQLSISVSSPRKAEICRQAPTEAFCEHNHTTVAGSQRRVKSRDQERRGSQDCRSHNLRWMLRPSQQITKLCCGRAHRHWEPAGQGGSPERHHGEYFAACTQHDRRATVPARASSWRSQRARWRGLAGIRIQSRLEA